LILHQMASKVFLYWGSGSAPCWRVMLALEEKGVPYESKLLEFSKNDHKGEEVLKWNPRGQLPTLVFDNSFAINESFAASEFLEEKSKKLVDAFLEELKHWEKYASEGDYIAGSALTLADVLLFPNIAVYHRMGLDLEKHAPHLFNYYNRMVKRPSVEKTWPPHWKTSPAPASIFG